MQADSDKRQKYSSHEYLCAPTDYLYEGLHERQALSVTCNTMLRRPKRYTDLEVIDIIDSEVTVPDCLTEAGFKEDFQQNTLLRWKINSYLLSSKNIHPLLSDYYNKKWKFWTVITNLCLLIIIISVSVIFQNPILLWWIVSLPIISVIGMGGATIPLIVLAILTLLRQYAVISDLAFWFIAAMLLVSFIGNKIKLNLATRSIIRYALTDRQVFWRYYKGGLIDIDLPRINKEVLRLTNKYPELLN